MEAKQIQAREESVFDDVLPGDEVSAALIALLDWAETYLLNVSVLIQIGLIFGALVPAIIFGPRLKRLISTQLTGRARTGVLRRLAEALAELATPIALYLTLTAIRIALGSAGQPMDWVAAALALMNAWILVRIVTLVIRSRFWSRLAFYIAWPIAALDAFGMLGPVVEQMRELAIPLGQGEGGRPIEFSLLDVIRTLFYFAILFWGATTLSRLLQQRLEKVEDLSPSLKAMISKVLNIVLPVVALVIALQVAGFNLATLAVFSGAVGLGIGLGLQRIAANFIAGFTLLADRSIKPGDVIEIDNTFGWVTAMQARYVAIRTRDGTEMLIPNDRFMTEGVTNWSRSDRFVRLHAPFGVAYGTEDLRLVQTLATEAAAAASRVVESPAPVCNLVAYGDSSVDFDLRFWITDPQNGMANVRSEVFIGLWDRLKANGIQIPFPQRDIHVRTWNDPPSPRA
ncbi:MAG TPA: mechanosensitive ion channel domain-containing protein [Pseudomonadales bacterium]